MIILTATERNSNLLMPLTHSRALNATQEHKGRKRPVSKLVFLCPSKILNAGLIRVKSSMVGCIWQLSSWSAPLSDCCNQIQSTAQELQLKAGGLFPYKGHKLMLNHIQKPLNKSVSVTENELIELSQIIGSIADSNSHFTSGLARFIDKIGKPLSEITLAELSTLIKLYRNAFNTGIEPSIEQVTVSPTKAKSLHKQHDIIGHSLEIFCLEPNEINRAGLKVDTLELARMLDDLPPSPKKTSCFNVLSRTRKLIAERVPFNQAMQYQDCIVKFAGMEA